MRRSNVLIAMSGLPGSGKSTLAACLERELGAVVLNKDRVRAALLSSNLPWANKRVTVNLAPSGVRKAGAGLDLPIAIGLLAALGEIRADALEGLAFMGELGLDGSIRSVPGMVPMAEAVTAPVLVVHDEIVVECDEGQTDAAAAWLKRAMLDGMAPLVAPVPVEVEVTAARTWGED